MRLPGSSSGWTSFEVINKDSSGTTPVSDALAASGKVAVNAVNKIRLVEEVGWPEARKLRFGPKGKSRVVKKGEAIWLLKCSPACWRLYFYVVPSPHQYIVYVHAACKKKDAEDPSDAIKATNVYEDIRAGRSAITAFPLPPG